MQTILLPEEFRARRKSVTEGKRIGFVPTMGALHEGHLSLMKQAKEQADHVVASIFVNPTQFGPNEDFSKYPRTLPQDLEALKSVGVDSVFLPNANHVYPEGFQTYVYNKELGSILCGASRPGHFEGVLTVVLKLLNMVRPDFALFGKKDFQQLKLIEKMVRDFNLGIQIKGGEIVREEDGLALSSRNRYLSDLEREQAPGLFKALKSVSEKFATGETDKSKLIDVFKKTLSEYPLFALDYVEIRESATLASIDGKISNQSIILAAAKLSKTRLIDNLELT